MLIEKSTNLQISLQVLFFPTIKAKLLSSSVMTLIKHWLPLSLPMEQQLRGRKCPFSLHSGASMQ